MIADRYALECEVGRGGMGAVWLARDQVLGRRVALKRVGWAPGGDSPDLARAEREARLAARLNHPHVVAVFDLVAEDDEQWLVMEYVEGVTLAALVQRDGPLSPDAAAPMLRQAADALAAAHAAGVVHRDVKPSNILVAPDGQVKLSDFGIARAEADASLTQTGLVTGSPAYLAPEVASGRVAQPPSDVWSLGATLFHALGGHPPYEVGENVLGALYRIVHEPPPRLDDAGWLTPALSAMMAPHPEQRWSMAQVRDFLAGGPAPDVPAPDVLAPEVPAPEVPAPEVPAPHAPAPEPTRRVEPAAPPDRPAASARRRPPGRPIAAVLGLLVVLALAGAAWTFGRGDDPERRADATTGRASGPAAPVPADPVSAEGMESFVTAYLATVTTDPAAAWQELTPGFQEQSGGFDQYRRFWSRYRSANVQSARADPESMRISYRVQYVDTRGRTSRDDVTLTLEGRDGHFLIAAEN